MISTIWGGGVHNIFFQSESQNEQTIPGPSVIEPGSSRSSSFEQLPGEALQREVTPEEDHAHPEDNVDGTMSWWQEPERHLSGSAQVTSTKGYLA